MRLPFPTVEVPGFEWANGIRVEESRGTQGKRARGALKQEGLEIHNQDHRSILEDGDTP